MSIEESGVVVVDGEPRTQAQLLPFPTPVLYLVKWLLRPRVGRRSGGRESRGRNGEEGLSGGRSRGGT